MRGICGLALVMVLAGCAPAPGIPGVPGSRTASTVALTGLVSVAGAVVGYGYTAVSATGNAAVSLVTGGVGAMTGAVAAPAGGAAVAPSAGAPAAQAATASVAGQAVTPSVEASQLTLQIRTAIEQAARSAEAKARVFLETYRPEIDACALRIFRSLVTDFGYATGTRFAVLLGDAVPGLPDAPDFLGIITISRDLTAALSETAQQARQSLNEMLAIESDVPLRGALAAASDLRTLCPSALISRLVGLLPGEEA